MTKENPKVERFAERDILAIYRDVETENLCLPSRGPIREAYLRHLYQKVPNDLQGRVFIDLIVVVMIHRALKGDVRAVKEITDRVDGRVSETCGGRSPVANIPNEHEPPPILKVVQNPKRTQLS